MEGERHLAIRADSGLGIGRIYPLQHDVLLFGRKPDAEILIEDAKASREHAMIEKTGFGLFVIKDLSSTNGTYLNGRRLVNPEPIKMGDKIRIGHQVFHVDELSRVQQQEMASWNTPTTLQNRSEIMTEFVAPPAGKTEKSKQWQWSVFVGAVLVLFALALFVNLQF